MGYGTDFRGQLWLNKTLIPEHEAYLRKFCTMSHIALDEEKLQAYSDPLREAVGLPVGKNGMYVTSVIDPGNEGDDLLSRYCERIDTTGTIARLRASYDDSGPWKPPYRWHCGSADLAFAGQLLNLQACPIRNSRRDRTASVE